MLNNDIEIQKKVILEQREGICIAREEASITEQKILLIEEKREFKG